MYYYLYQTTNRVNGKIYVGVHKTKDLEDGYMGSGKVIKHAIAKHGIENFTKDILEFFENAELMYAREKEIITEEFLLREDVYNLRRGGTGGFDHIQKNVNYKDWVVAGALASHAARKQKYGVKKYKQNLQDAAKRGSKVLIKKIKENGGKIWWTPVKSFKGRTHTLKTKLKMSLAKKGNCNGKFNSQFGTMWITNGISNQKIKNDFDIPTGWYRGRTIGR
jgi:hypothetical protein